MPEFARRCSPSCRSVPTSHQNKTTESLRNSSARVRASTPRSDLYALGFVLWHLLAGRPAFPTGDPLAKLAAHQTERLPDIREFAPDTPDQLARTIEWLTEPTPSRRPRNAKELLVDGTRHRAKLGRQNAQRADNKTSKPNNEPQPKISSQKQTTAQTVSIKPAGRSSRRRLARFASGFQQPVRRTSQSSSTRRTATSLACACAAVLVAVGALLTFDVNSRNLVLARLPQRLVESVSNDRSVTGKSPAPKPSTEQPSNSDELPATTATMKPVNSSGDRKTLPATASEDSQERANSVARQRPQPASEAFGLLPLPEPDPYGLVLLSEPGSYDAASISWPSSHLIIRGAAGVPTTIVVSTQPLQLRATEVTLENVELRFAAESWIDTGNSFSDPLAETDLSQLQFHDASFGSVAKAEGPRFRRHSHPDWQSSGHRSTRPTHSLATSNSSTASSPVLTLRSCSQPPVRKSAASTL